MKQNNKKIWKSPEQFLENKEFNQKNVKEFPNEGVMGIFNDDNSNNASRRDFLKLMGFSTMAATIAACQAPLRKVVPYVKQPEEVTPGVANYYASSFYDGFDFGSIVVKTREGRPIHIEGNKKSISTNGSINARINSSVLSLYDTNRLKTPIFSGNETSYEKVTDNIKAALINSKSINKNSVLLTSSIISPSTNSLIDKLKEKYGVEHIIYDAISYSALIEANQKNFNIKAIPDYNFEKAETIVSISADFLSTWLFSNRFISGYQKGRTVVGKDKMSKHYQIESNLTVTGANADKRIIVKPSDYSVFLSMLNNSIAEKVGQNNFVIVDANPEFKEIIEGITNKLISTKEKSIVICGINEVCFQEIVNNINSMLNNYGNTINFSNPILLKKGIDSDFKNLITRIEKGEIDTLLMYDVNPIYTYNNRTRLEKAFANIKKTFLFTYSENETSTFTDYIIPISHHLESWGDSQPLLNEITFQQPTIYPLFNTLQFQEVLLKLIGENISYADYLKNFYKNINDNSFLTYDDFWNSKLEIGTYNNSQNVKEVKLSSIVFDSKKVSLENLSKTVTGKGLELELYIKIGIGDGTNANNPWLQELPDPISRITWDNYITMSPKQMREMGLTILGNGETYADLVEINVNGVSLKVPVIAQPGQAYGTIGLAVGYGRINSGKVADNIGVNAYYLINNNNNTFSTIIPTKIELTKTGEKTPIGATQTHHTIMARHNILKETELSEYLKDKKAGNEDLKLASYKGNVRPEKLNLWEDQEGIKAGHRWGLTIDLNTCIGCSACVTSCQSENNVPVVGRDEVRRSREMHWIRIDRYYSSDASENDLDGLEKASEAPEVSFQPIMCQHCNHAPCETVCPVAATTHSSEGLNQMTYNRCIGTRYCANNCPYKVRRFNWFKYAENDKFDYNMNNDLGKLVLNPDVTVRARGVMEKCSLCVQRIQTAKLKAKVEERKIIDGEVETACMSACPTKAINFGDLNNNETEVAKTSKTERAYNLLEEVGTQPNVWYLTKIRNKS